MDRHFLTIIFAKHTAVFFISTLPDSVSYPSLSPEGHLSHFHFSHNYNTPIPARNFKAKALFLYCSFLSRLLLVKARIFILLNIHDKHLSTKDLASQPSIHSIITGITYWNDGRWVKHYIHIIWFNRHLSRNNVVSGVIIGLFTGSREQWLAIWYENCIITQF